MIVNGLVAGDSLTGDIAAQLALERPGETWNNSVVSAMSIEQMLTDFPTLSATYYQPGYDNVFVPSLGHGNCQDTSQTAAQVYALYEQMVALAQSYGWRVVAMTIPGTTEFNDPLASPYKKPVRQQFNSLLRADLAGSNFLLDIDTFPGICTNCVPDSGPADPLYYKNDTPAFGAIHLTTYSDSLIAEGISDLLNEGIPNMATPVRLYGPTSLTTSAADKYTVPASTIAVVKRIRVSNPGGGAVRAFTLSIGNDAAGTRLYDAMPVPVTGLDIYGPFTLAAGQKIQAFADNVALVLTIDGTEQPA